MGLVHDQTGAVAAGQAGEAFDGGEVAVHAVDALAHDEALAPRALVPAERLLQEAEVEVGKDDLAASGEADAVDETRVVRGIRVDRVRRPDDGAQKPHVGQVPRAEEQRRFRSDPRGESLFEGRPRFDVAGQEAGSGCRDPRRCAEGRLDGLTERRVPGEAEIVIRAEPRMYRVSERLETSISGPGLEFPQLVGEAFEGRVRPGPRPRHRGRP
jgi:hypothetical protein